MTRPITTEEANAMRLRGYEKRGARAKRRREIARVAYAQGSSVEEIADAMKLKPRVVYTYLEGILVDKRRKKRA